MDEVRLHGQILARSLQSLPARGDPSSEQNAPCLDWHGASPPMISTSDRRVVSHGHLERCSFAPKHHRERAISTDHRRVSTRTEPRGFHIGDHQARMRPRHTSTQWTRRMIALHASRHLPTSKPPPRRSSHVGRAREIGNLAYGKPLPTGGQARQSFGLCGLLVKPNGLPRFPFVPSAGR